MKVIQGQKSVFLELLPNYLQNVTTQRTKKLYQGDFDIHTKFCKNLTIFVGVMPLTNLTFKVKIQFFKNIFLTNTNGILFKE